MHVRQIILLVISLFIFGCGSGGGGGGETNPENLRFFHAEPETGAIDLSLNGEKAFSGVDYGDVSSTVDVLEGTLPAEVKSELNVLPIVSKDLTIAAGKSYTLFFTQTAGAEDLILQEDTNTEPDEGEFRIRITNFAPSRGTVDVYIQRPGVSVKNQSPTLSALAYQAFSDYLGIDEGEFVIKYTGAGSKTVIRETEPITFSEGRTYTHVLLDREGGGSPLTSRLLLDN